MRSEGPLPSLLSLSAFGPACCLTLLAIRKRAKLTLHNGKLGSHALQPSLKLLNSREPNIGTENRFASNEISVRVSTG
jgi:hypothetical protein